MFLAPALQEQGRDERGERAEGWVLQVCPSCPEVTAAGDSPGQAAAGHTDL